MTRILAYRFSAFGDVAMTAPIIKAYAQENKSSRFTVVSQPFLKPLFEGVDNVDFFAADIKKEYKGFTGLFKLFLDLKKYSAIQVNNQKIIQKMNTCSTKNNKVIANIEFSPNHS